MESRYPSHSPAPQQHLVYRYIMFAKGKLPLVRPEIIGVFRTGQFQIFTTSIILVLEGYFTANSMVAMVTNSVIMVNHLVMKLPHHASAGARGFSSTPFLRRFTI
eukprot:sb/3477921/